MLIGIIDYGAGNLRSVANSFDRLGVRYFISSDRKELDRAHKLVLPGVGEARSAMDSLERVELIEWLRRVEKPFLGICLGMQLLFDRSTERSTDCLGVIPGNIQKFDQPCVKVPHMGWNQVRARGSNPLVSNIHDDEFFYFVHSYYAPIVEETIGVTEYGMNFTSAVQKENYYGVQFHPEKSGAAGLRMLKNFVDLC